MPAEKTAVSVFQNLSSTVSTNAEERSKIDRIKEANLKTKIPPEDLTVSALQENNQDSDGSSSSYIIPIISFCFIGVSACAVYFIRRKKVILSEGDDFEILDE
jgi:cobalamin biosynthesis Mg chelatase CobN